MESIRALIRAVSKHEKDILRMSDGNIFALSFIQSQRESRRRQPMQVRYRYPALGTCGALHPTLHASLHSILLYRIVRIRIRSHEQLCILQWRVVVWWWLTIVVLCRRRNRDLNRPRRGRMLCGRAEELLGPRLPRSQQTRRAVGQRTERQAEAGR